MKKRILALVLVVLFMAGIVMASENKAHDFFKRQSEKDRREAFVTIINTANFSCDRVTFTMHWGFDEEDTSFWTTSCTNGRSYMIGIYNDKNYSTRVLECGVLKLIGIDCFKKP